MRTLYNWTAKRSGARMTLRGLMVEKGQEDREVTVANVNKIEVDAVGALATVDGGDRIRLYTLRR